MDLLGMSIQLMGCFRIRFMLNTANWGNVIVMPISSEVLCATRYVLDALDIG